MKVFKKKELLQKNIEKYKKDGFSVGFVPTMGALHKGHLSLVAASQQKNKLTVVSIFVNPTQFDNPDDLKKYPSSLEKDLSLLEQLNCDVVFTPEVSEMYSQNAVAEKFNFGSIESQMEGAFRMGHFNGVGTIVKRLFQIVKPDRAYFGEKDFQQLQIIKKLVEIEKMDVEIIGCPIFREPNGLAMSSRNERLTKSEQNIAAFIYKTLLQVKENYPNHSIEKLKSWVYMEFKKHNSLSIEYFNISDEETLLEISNKSESSKPRAFIAVFLNSVRLIDNLALYN